MSSHERPNRGATNVWITPQAIIAELGPFDLDPCAADQQPWPTAARSYTKQDDGLTQRWDGRVWLNPPYGDEVGTWLDRLAAHGDGIALVMARTETAWFQRAATFADAILFKSKRITFHHEDGTPADGNAGAPSCFMAFGSRNVASLASSSIDGFFVGPIARTRRALQIAIFA